MRSTFILFLLTIPLLPACLQAQTGAIAGTVSDPQGAVVAHAKVTARNVATNTVRTVQSGAAGAYSIPNLNVGAYEVIAGSTGFKSAKIQNVIVTVAEIVTLNIRLKLGTVTETVLVSPDLPAAVELQSTQTSNLVDSTRINNLPMLTRDPYTLVLLSSGVIQSNTRLGGFAVNGSRERNNNFLLDGADNNDTSVPGGPGGLIGLNPEATQEFRVVTGNFMAEFGRNSGAIIDVVTKSGTNTLHGDAHWFGRYNATGARDWFNTEDQPQNPYERNIFGFSLGGPIRKDKTFFFVNNEFQRFRTTLTNESIVPTAAFKSGKFTWKGTPIDMTNPANFCPGAPPFPAGCNFAGMTLDPAIQNILSKYPSPNGGAVDDIRGIYRFPTTSDLNSYNLNVKGDHRLTDKHNLSVRYAYNRGDDTDPQHSEFLPGFDRVSTVQRARSISADLSSVLRNSLVNDFKFGFNRFDGAFSCNSPAFDAFSPKDAFGRTRDYSLPDIAGFGCLTLGNSNGQNRRTGTYSFGDTLTWVKGPHTIKAGAEYRRVFENGYNDFSSRDVLFFNNYSNFAAPSVNVPVANASDIVVQDMAWMLTGLVGFQTQTQLFNKAEVRTADDNRRFRQHEYAFFVQDSWKLKPNITLNLGLRYQFNGVPFEEDGNLSTLFANPAGTAPFTFTLVGPGTGRNLYNNDLTNFEPRLGIAWDPFKKSKTSVRASWGIFHDRIFGNLFGNSRGDPPFQRGKSDVPSDVPENVDFPKTTAASAVVNNGAGITPFLLDPNLKMPRIMSWSFGIQQELARNLTIEVNYVGTNGDRLLRLVDGNPPDPALVAQLISLGVNPANFSGTFLPWFGFESGLLPFDPVHNNAFLSAFLNKSIAISNYNALQLTVTKRMSNGLQIQGAYTWSHALDNASDPLDPAQGNLRFPRNSHNLRPEYGNSDFDIRHRLVINYTYELPVGRGQQYASSGVAGRILEGWMLSGITSFQTGHPYEIFGNRDSQHSGVTYDRLNLVSDPFLANPSASNQTGLNINAFALAPYNTASNLTRNQFYGPSYSNFDAVLAKRTKLGERFTLENRFEFYNLLNHPQFQQPDNLIQNTRTFGFSLATIVRPDATTSARQVQFGAKLIF